MLRPPKSRQLKKESDLVYSTQAHSNNFPPTSFYWSLNVGSNGSLRIHLPFGGIQHSKKKIWFRCQAHA